MFYVELNIKHDWGVTTKHNTGPAFFQIGSQALQEITTVPVILKYRLPFNASGNNVVKRPRRIYACLAREKESIPEKKEVVNL